MSFLVELPLDQYRADAMNSLRIAPGFGLDNARAMMWMSQLAYETPNETPPERKVSTILGRWNFTKVDCIANPEGTRLPLRTACAIVAAGRGATIVSFAGTDPLKINDWITDFNALPSADGAHTGFMAAVDEIWPRIASAIAKGLQTDGALFFTGHSLGGALAIIAAEKAPPELQVRVSAIYTFGSPRPGDFQFATSYNPGLRDKIYRLVHGTDIVATVGPSEVVGFYHVGQMLACASGGRFDGAASLLASTNNEPDFVKSFFESALNTFRMSMAGQLPAPIGHGLLGRFFGILPQQIRDHVPPNYFRALGS